MTEHSHGSGNCFIQPVAIPNTAVPRESWCAYMLIPVSCSVITSMVQAHCESISSGSKMLSAARSKHSNSVNKVPTFARQFAELQFQLPLHFVPKVPLHVQLSRKFRHLRSKISAESQRRPDPRLLLKDGPYFLSNSGLKQHLPISCNSESSPD